MDRNVDAAKLKAEEGKAEVKQGWFEWLGWGKSKAEGAKKDVAATAAHGARDVKEGASKAEGEAAKRAV